MSTASIISGLLNASGLKERLSEYGGKAKLPSFDFPVMEKLELGNDVQENRFPAQFEELAENKEVEDSEGDLPGQEVQVGDQGLMEGDESVFVDGEAEVADIPVASNDQALPDDKAARQVPMTVVADVAVSQQGQSGPAKASAEEGTEADNPKSSAPVERTGHDVRERSPLRTSGHVAVSRDDAGVATQSAQGFTRNGATELFPSPRSVREPLQRQSASDVVPPGLAGLAARSGQTPGTAPAVTVTGFNVASMKADYPANLTERFSQRLDMMRPVFRPLPSSDGLTRASEASGQAMLLPSASTASGTLPQIQQAIQSSLVDLARESKGSSPTARTMELSLVPRSLGEIRVHMMHTGNRISVEIVTSTVAATQAMETAKNDIVKAYLQFGIQPEEVNIRVTETRDTAQTTQPGGSDQDRLAQGGGQGLARHGAGFSMAERQEADRWQGAKDTSVAGSEELKPIEAARPVRTDVMGKVQYF